MKVYYDKDADLSIIKGKKVAIIGYGSQGHAHAQNLKESGVDVIVGLRKDGASWSKAEAAGHKVKEVAEAVKKADVVMILLPDESQPEVYHKEIAPNIKKGAALAFAHGFNVHYNQIVPREDLDVIMVAPKGPGHTVRSEYVKGGGVPTLIAVYQDKSGKARDVALSYAAANGGTKGGVIETNFREETRNRPVRRTGCTVWRRGRTGESWFRNPDRSPVTLRKWLTSKCLHELKLIVDLMYEGGIANMNYSISNNAEYGEYVTGPEVVTSATKEAMKKALYRIQSGEYAKMFILEGKTNYPSMTARRRLTADHPIEKVGAELRAMMPWISKNKLVDQSKN
uniref:Acetohydroxy-acid reductoisomerase n=1 Tax=Anopheles coluzzii TaxID=1518534 RepID=A0A8W7PRN8_ANOCL